MHTDHVECFRAHLGVTFWCRMLLMFLFLIWCFLLKDKVDICFVCISVITVRTEICFDQKLANVDVSWFLTLVQFDRFSKVAHFSSLLKVCCHIYFPFLFSSLLIRGRRLFLTLLTIYPNKLNDIEIFMLSQLEFL